MRGPGGGAALRAFANEDIYFFVKRIDNTRVVREADPQARGTCWKLIGSVVSAVVLLIFVLLPSAYGLLAGYQIQTLRQDGERLATEQASLELAEAKLLSPARMEAAGARCSSSSTLRRRRWFIWRTRKPVRSR